MRSTQVSKFPPELIEKMVQEYYEDGILKRVAKKYGTTPRTLGKHVELDRKEKAEQAQDKGKGPKNDNTPAPAPIAPRKLVGFPGYVRSRSLGNSPSAAVIEMELPHDRSAIFEFEYIRLVEDAASYALFTKNRSAIQNIVALKTIADTEGIDLKTLLEGVKGKGSVRMYLAELEALESKTVGARSEFYELRDRILPYLRDEANKWDRTIRGYSNNLAGLVASIRYNEAQLADLQAKTRNLALMSTRISDGTTEGAKQVVQEFLENNNRLVDHIFISILMALSRCPPYKLARTLAMLSVPIEPEEANNLLSAFRFELGVSVDFTQKFLQEAGEKFVQAENFQ